MAVHPLTHFDLPCQWEITTNYGWTGGTLHGGENDFRAEEEQEPTCDEVEMNPMIMITTYQEPTSGEVGMN